MGTYVARLEFDMTEEPTYEQLLRRVKELEEVAFGDAKSGEVLQFTQFAIDHFSDAAFWMSSDARFVYVNESACRSLGYSKEELLFMTVHDIDPDFPPEIWAEHWLEMKRRGSSVVESRHKRKTGEIFPVELTINFLKYEGKEYHCTFARDLTPQKQATEALRESQAQLQAVLDYSPALIYIKDLNGNILLANRHFEILDGPPPAELVGKNIFDLLPEDLAQALWRDDRQALETGGPLEAEEVLKHRDGSLHTYLSIKFPLYKEPGNPFGICVISTNITARKGLEQKSLEAEKMKAIASLSGGIAHEFNNALVGIYGNIEMLQINLPENLDAARESLRIMKVSAQRMAKLTNQLLAYAQEGIYHARIMSLNDFIEDTLPLIRHSIGPEIGVKTVLSPQDISINADPTQLQMVLSAILSNAVEALNGQGRIMLTALKEYVDPADAKFHGIIHRPGPYACLVIQDKGKGMDHETRTRIFDPFFTTKFQGRGLGMAAAYGIVNRHNVAILVDSKLGKGTTVHVYLPAIEAESQEDKPTELEIITGTGTILLIEDEPIVMEVSRAMLEKLGYRVIEARTGKEAVEIAQNLEEKLDLALLDMKMPDMSGADIYHAVQKFRHHLKVIVCSGYAYDGPVQEVLNSGAQDFMQKPFSFTALSKMVHKVLKSRD